MTSDVQTVTPKTTLADALSVCRTHRIRHLPVLEGERLEGLVSDRDLRLSVPAIWADQQDELQQALRTRTVGEVMVRDIITTSPDLPVEEAAKLLIENRVGCLPVMEGEKLVGMLTETDLLHAFVELFGTSQATSRLEVRMPNRPGELARVVRVIGIEQRVNITGLVLPPTDGGESSLAIMHVQTLNPRPLINALRKLGYDVGWPSLDLPDHEIEVARGTWDGDRVTLPL